MCHIAYTRRYVHTCAVHLPIFYVSFVQVWYICCLFSSISLSVTYLNIFPFSPLATIHRWFWPCKIYTQMYGLYGVSNSILTAILERTLDGYCCCSYVWLYQKKIVYLPDQGTKCNVNIIRWIQHAHSHVLSNIGTCLFSYRKHRKWLSNRNTEQYH